MVPLNLLPLRSQRGAVSSRRGAVSTLAVQARSLGLAGRDLHIQLRGDEEEISGGAWAELSQAFLDVDSYWQDELAQKDEALANAYLLGRGLAECYWGLGPRDEWEVNRGCSPVFLLGDERRDELTRMLGRLDPGVVHDLTPSCVDGTLRAWQQVAENAEWLAASDLPDQLYAQARVWYQLLVLGQDPTTQVAPGAKLTSARYAWRTLKAFWPTVTMAAVALGLTTTAVTTDELAALLPGGIGALGVAGLLGKGQSTAQQMLTRLRQDAYTDLVAYSVTLLPERPEGVRTSTQSLVRLRSLTPPTPAPATA